MYKYICKECGKEFVDYKKGRKYCSYECHINARNKNSDKKFIGKKFGRLKVIRCKENYKSTINQRHYECFCECGNTIVVPGSSLLSGLTRSCGCLQKEKSSKNIKIQNKKFQENQLVEGTSLSSIKANFKNNTSGVKGVLYDKCNKAWVAVLTFQRKVYRKRFKGSEQDKEAKTKAIQYRKYLEEKYHKPILDKYKDKS